MNTEKGKLKKNAFLKKERQKYNVAEAELNFDNPSYRNPEVPSFDPAKMTLDNYSGPWESAQMTHLIRRLKFGISIKDLSDFSSLSMEQSVNLLLIEAPEPGLPINDYNNGEDIFDPDVPFGETWINAPYSDFEGEKVMSLKRWWIDNILNQGHSITEKMMLFWHNHIVTEWFGVFVANSSYKYMATIRKHQMGSFKQLIRDITVDVSMLLYLNGAQNHKDAPDENYARELQELFCIGKGENALFTENDVRSAARILTGWSVSWPELEMIYDPWRHDENDKQFSEFYGNRLISGRSGENGKEELDDLMDMIFDNEESALFITRKIYTFFVYPQITSEVEENIIQPLAQMLRENNFVIKPVLEKLFKSEHFYDPNIKGSVIKDPTNQLLGMWRTLNPPVPQEWNIYEQGELKSSMLWSMYGIGMQLGDPPSVAGWPAYYQVPIFDKGWITTNTITSRAIHSDSIVYWGFWSPNGQIPADLLGFIDTFDDPGNPNALIDTLALLFLGHEIEQETKDRFKNILLSGQAQDYYWTTAWATYKSDPSNVDYRAIVENRLKWMMQRILQIAEAHLF
jgi:uncharacterized protein (DUF1800 family)